jgi:hypothetical protein
MGRKRIKIREIQDEKSKSVTFLKRKYGLMKKAYELSILCDCEVGIIILKKGKLIEFSSSDMDDMLLRYTEFTGPYEKRSLADVNPPFPNTP